MDSLKKCKLTGICTRNDVRLFRVSSPVKNPKIRNDTGGKGHFHAPRGSRLHHGIDLQTEVGEALYAPISGEITKVGYSNSIHQYVEITGSLDLVDLNGNIEQGDNCTFRVHYIKPSVKKGDWVKQDQKIGESDDLHRQNQYPKKVGQHTHIEVIIQSGDKIDPARILPHI